MRDPGDPGIPALNSSPMISPGAMELPQKIGSGTLWEVHFVKFCCILRVSRAKMLINSSQLLDLGGEKEAHIGTYALLTSKMKKHTFQWSTISSF